MKKKECCEKPFPSIYLKQKYVCAYFWRGVGGGKTCVITLAFIAIFWTSTHGTI